MRYPLILLFVLASYLSFSQITVDVRSLGAVGDSATLNTTFIQQAIDNVSNAGGGTVLIDSGIYSSSTIILKSNVTLRITPGTVLKGLADASYPYIAYNTPSWPTYQYTQQSMIFAEQASNIRITGGGTIDGNGFQINFLSIAKNFRPMGLRLHDINGLIIDSINLRQAPQWMVHIMGCSNVHINAVDVYNQCWGVNDGIDIDCCTNVLAENSHFDTNDDCIPVKTQANDSVCRDVTIRNCTMATFERPVKVGCESFGPLINIRFQNITVNASSYALSETPLNAIYIGIADGGSADSIFIDSIQVNTLFTTPVFIRL
jgi:polygalacturonase